MISQLTKTNNYLAEWKKRDPFLQDVEGFTDFVERRSRAEELLRLIRLGHPDSHGEPFTRSQVIRTISEQGLTILKELGWPTEMTSKYVVRHTGEIVTLEQALWNLSDDLNPWRHQMHKMEEELAELTNEDFYCSLDADPKHFPEGKCRFAARGLETWTVREMRKLLELYPFIKEKVRECLRLHKAFYEHLGTGRYGEPKLLEDESNRDSECPKNIASMCRMFHIDVDELEDITEFPSKSIEEHVWSVLETYEPASKDGTTSELS